MADGFECHMEHVHDKALSIRSINGVLWLLAAEGTRLRASWYGRHPPLSWAELL